MYRERMEYILLSNNLLKTLLYIFDGLPDWNFIHRPSRCSLPLEYRQPLKPLGVLLPLKPLGILLPSGSERPLIVTPIMPRCTSLSGRCTFVVVPHRTASDTIYILLNDRPKRANKTREQVRGSSFFSVDSKSNRKFQTKFQLFHLSN